MDIRYLRHFLVVADELHFGRAARRLNMSQAPLSQSIKRLEAHLNVRLFDRAPGAGTRLTDAGRRLRPEAERAVLQFEAALDTARQTSSQSSIVIRCGFVTLGLIGPLERAIRAMERSHPDVSVSLEEGSTTGLVERVANGRLDLALVHPLGRPPSDVRVRAVRRDRIVAALPAAHRLAGRDRVGLRDVANDPLILFPPSLGPDLHARIVDAFGALKLEPRIKQEARSTPTMLLMVAAGLGYALLPESARYLPFSNVAFVPLSDLPEHLDWGLWLAHRDGEASAAVLAFAERIHGGDAAR